MFPAYPYRFDNSGATAEDALADHIRDMIEQLLLTSPGERVNRPTFGCGSAQLVFEPNSDVLAAAQQQIIQSALGQWLSDLIRVRSVTVAAQDSTLLITVQYTLVATQQPQTRQFVLGASS